MDLISKTHMVCNGCTREGVTWDATGYNCPVYEDQSKVAMIRLGGCTFNGSMTKNSKKTGKVRAGQQKTKRIGG